MGIYISGINLPKGKHSIVEITITEDGTVFTGSTDTFHKSDLRAVEIPTPHGRLIDLDKAHIYALEELFDVSPSYITNTEAAKAMMNIYEHMPIVIEAEEKE